MVKCIFAILVELATALFPMAAKTLETKQGF
jgi:hypothetical protein